MSDVSDFNAGLDGETKNVCDTIRDLIDGEFGSEGSRLYHGAPVWFLDDNPIVGYSVKKAGVSVLFWSGQSFTQPGLKATGKFKAAELLVVPASGVPTGPLKKWLGESRSIIWDYKSIREKNGALERLTGR